MHQASGVSLVGLKLFAERIFIKHLVGVALSHLLVLLTLLYTALASHDVWADELGPR